MSLKICIKRGGPDTSLADILKAPDVEFLLLDEYVIVVVSSSKPLTKTQTVQYYTQTPCKEASTPEPDAVLDEHVFTSETATKFEGKYCWMRHVQIKGISRYEVERFHFHVCLLDSSTKKAMKDTHRYLEDMVPVHTGLDFGLGVMRPNPQLNTKITKKKPTICESSEHFTHKTMLEETMIEILVKHALRMGLKCVRPLLEKTHLIAQLDLEPSQVSLSVSSLTLSLKNGTVSPLSETEYPLQIPVQFSHSFSFGLETTMNSGSSIKGILTVKVDYQALLENGQLSNLTTTWNSPVDFDDSSGPLPKTPSFALHASPTLNNRGSNISLASGFSMGDSMRVSKSPLAGVSILFEGPNEVTVGKELRWNIMVLNKSPRSRKLSLFFQNGDTSQQALISCQEERSLVCGRNTLGKRLAIYRYNNGAGAGLIPLVNELRLGTLAPNSCFETSVRLLALAPGRHSIASSWLFDNISNETYDLGELLDVKVN